MTAVARLLPDGRLHLQHGPMDLIVEAWGPEDTIRAAYARAWACFQPLLDELVAEREALRAADDRPVMGPTARAMADAVRPFRPTFITPMAAVAGAVADRVLAALAGPGITKAYVNNGGDIALYLTPGQSLTAAIAGRAGLPDRVTICHDDPVRGIATSGWRGRSFSLGIADAATILAPTAAMADAAATIIANAVELPGHPAITRRPAVEIKSDSDLGTRLVTTGVGLLSPHECAAALENGLRCGAAAMDRGLIVAAALCLQGQVRTLNSSMSPTLSFTNIPGGVRGGQRPPRRVAAKGGETPARKEPSLV
ncbi:UPF0280 family protein [Frigidibacter sp. RF13]|uniref:UPF0280 family protein n=1 Tax=Frigidibacter sp. RF13 TaxID=2997340 RepID=UPI00226E09D2|nr:UPF0280 family protein [Frigidibacter sp. RF13]MCY1125769.1 UPF0280 family protein [Frigidibacter sp. RF13]